MDHHAERAGERAVPSGEGEVLRAPCARGPVDDLGHAVRAPRVGRSPRESGRAVACVQHARRLACWTHAFHQHELTVAVTAAAKVVAGGTARRRAKGGATWEAMSKIERYHLLEAVGGQVLPVLLALPDVEVEAGTRPTFTDAQIAAAVEETLGETGIGRLRQKVAVAARLTLVRTALAQLPARQDPDALIVPTHL